MPDNTGTDSDIIRRQQERDLGHKLDHPRDKRHGPPAELVKPVKQPKHRYFKDWSDVDAAAGDS